MQQLAEAAPPWESLPYLDRIWAAKRLPHTCRTRLLEMHREGVLEYEELSLDTLKALCSSGLDEDGALWLLRRFCRRVATAPLQDDANDRQAGGHSGAWKNAMLLDLLAAQVRSLPHCQLTSRRCIHAPLRDASSAPALEQAVAVRRGLGVASRWPNIHRWQTHVFCCADRSDTSAERSHNNPLLQLHR
jgi:hypothetical protein